MLIADITGYTTYLAGTEIDHAQNVLEDLLEAVVAKLAPPFTVIKGEGDAVFLYAPEGAISETLLLDSIDSSYYGFRRRLRDVTQATSCECNACVLIPSLDLKFVVHGGQAIRQSSFGQVDLVGTDVIVVHRLLKNHVVEEHGWRGYALLTDAAVTSVGLDCMRLGMVAHREVYEDAGEIAGFVEDLGARWREEQARTAERLTADRAWATFEADLPASPPIAWEYTTSPRWRQRWQVGVTGVNQSNPDGRPGVGTTNHCMHGPSAVIEDILEYQPFESMTMNALTPFGPMLMTFSFTPTNVGTHLAVMCAMEPTEENRRVFAAGASALAVPFEAGLTNLTAMLAEKATQDQALLSVGVAGVDSAPASS